MEKLEIKLLSDSATNPKRADDLSAGYDIYAAETVTIEPQEKVLVDTDIAVNIPKGYVGLLTSRSGVSSKTHLVVETGKIDAGFQGHMKINVKNDRLPVKKRKVSLSYLNIEEHNIYEPRNKCKYKIGTYKIEKGDRLAQLLIVPIATPELQEVNEFSNKTVRGTNGFGSTGYNK